MRVKQFDPSAIQKPQPINIHRPDAPAKVRAAAATDGPSSARAEKLIFQHVKTAMSLARLLKTSRDQARSIFFKQDHQNALNDQKWGIRPIWRLSLLQKQQLIKKSKGRINRLQREDYERDLLERLAYLDEWFEVISPDSKGDQRRWLVRLAVAFYANDIEKLTELVRQNVINSGADFRILHPLFMLAPASKEARAKRDAPKHAKWRAQEKERKEKERWEARSVALKEKMKAQQENAEYERLVKADIDPNDDFMCWDLFMEFYPREIPLHLYEAAKAKARGEPYVAVPIYKDGLAPKEAEKPKKMVGKNTGKAPAALVSAAAELEELDGMLDPFSVFDMSNLIAKGDENDQ